MNVKKIIGLGVVALSLTVVAAATPRYLKASDHDDGEVDNKGRNLNLTDLFVFREQDQNPNASANDLIFVMNTNPRSLPRQQYYFSTNASYDFHVTRVADKNATPTGAEDVILRFRFADKDSSGRQSFRMSVVRNGVETTTTRTTSGSPLVTTPLTKATTPTINQVSVGGSNLSVFAGLREDPFFFDVTRYFQVRASLLKKKGFLNIPLPDILSFRPPDKAIDFTKDYNVNTIVVRVPRALLQNSTNATTFDVWETISLRQPDNTYKQFERLARPAINEGLIFTNDFLNAFNMIPPSADLSPAAAPVRAEAIKTLKAFGNTDAQATAKALAFLPDVMRIDTTQPSGYGKALNTKGSPITGRLIKDDVIDTTITVVTQGTPLAAVKSDNVFYEGVPDNPAQGHDQPVQNLPYLALPN
ncbi:MAG: DUF4331 domain-containing protein [Aphanothece sp. CMT-3BRIN-NPC111]|jgi:hypothetical protein|nr:DUF4331 domain-containing protein [Aphanothece sp. CMT-3BRIN-NPC111]